LASDVSSQRQKKSKNNSSGAVRMNVQGLRV